VLQVVLRVLKLPNTADWWKAGLRVTVRMAAKVKAHTPVVLVLMVDNVLNIRTHADATDGIKTR